MRRPGADLCARGVHCVPQCVTSTVYELDAEYAGITYLELNLRDVASLYEAKMFPRAAEAARQSAFGLDMIFNDDAPKDLVKFFSSMEEPVGAAQ